MGSYEVYKNAGTKEVKDFMLRRMFGEYDSMNQTIKNLTAELEELNPRKGVPNELKVMQWRSKPPDNIA